MARYVTWCMYLVSFTIFSPIHPLSRHYQSSMKHNLELYFQQVWLCQLPGWLTIEEPVNHSLRLVTTLLFRMAKLGYFFLHWRNLFFSWLQTFVLWHEADGLRIPTNLLFQKQWANATLAFGLTLESVMVHCVFYKSHSFFQTFSRIANNLELFFAIVNNSILVNTF